jgi:hypothetical protein
MYASALSKSRSGMLFDFRQRAYCRGARMDGGSVCTAVGVLGTGVERGKRQVGGGGRTPTVRRDCFGRSVRRGCEEEPAPSAVPHTPGHHRATCIRTKTQPTAPQCRCMKRSCLIHSVAIAVIAMARQAVNQSITHLEAEGDTATGWGKVPRARPLAWLHATVRGGTRSHDSGGAAVQGDLPHLTVWCRGTYNQQLGPWPRAGTRGAWGGRCSLVPQGVRSVAGGGGPSSGRCSGLQQVHEHARNGVVEGVALDDDPPVALQT